MKVLYVEDEIGSNIPGIINLFGHLLGGDVVKQLEELNKAEYPATLDEIKQVVESSAAVDLAYSFPMALRKIEEDHDAYSMFIIDRNLKAQEGELEEVKSIVKKCTIDKLLKFAEREGDFLLQHLSMKEVDLFERVFILSAYSDDLKLDEHTLDLISYNKLRQDNFIEKANPSHMDKLKGIIRGKNHLNLKIEYRNVFRVLSQPPFSPEDEKKFLAIITRVNNNDNASRDIIFPNSRYLLERIFICLNKHDDHIVPLKFLTYDKKDETQTQCRKIIRHFVESGMLEKDSIPERFNWLVYTLCSDLIHAKYEAPDYNPTKHTARAVLEMLCDLILWAGDVISKNNS